MLSVVYASLTHSIRANLWSYFDDVIQRVGLPSSFIGDFNELVSCADKNCGPFHGRFAGLKNWMDRNAMVDMGFTGSCYT